jgi:DNA-directed RNA polymerase sigma subunit (sigma70/sigma32)
MYQKKQLKILFVEIFGIENIELFDAYDFNEGLEKVFPTLGLREECAIKTRYFKEKTLKETGKLILRDSPYDNINPCSGVSPERARQMIAKALRKLRHPTRSKKLFRLDTRTIT